MGYIIVNFMLVMAAFIAGALEANRLRKRHFGLSLENAHRKAGWHIAFALAGLLLVVLISIPVVNNPLMWHGPLWFDRYNLQTRFGLLGMAAGFLSGLVLLLGYKTAHGRRHTLSLLMLGVLAVLLYLQWMYTRPASNLSRQDVLIQGVIIQSHGSTCAAASGANIARSFGANASERGMAEAMGVMEMSGASAGMIIAGMKSYGIECQKFQLPPSRIWEAPAPAFLFVDYMYLPPEGHAVAFMGVKEGIVEVWDPLSGKDLVPLQEFVKTWRGKGVFCRKL